MSNVAVNDAGDVVIFDGTAWQPAPMAQNGRGERVYFDGQAWQPVQMRAPEPVVDAARAAGGAVVNAAQRVADVPGSWWGRRARDLLEGPAAAIDAAIDAMNPGRAVARDMMTPEQRARLMPGARDLAQGAADRIGLASPQTPGERMTSAVVQGAAGAIPTLGAGVLARAPAAIGGLTGAASQFVGGGVGGGASEAVAQAGYGPVTQAVAGLAGGVAGAGATQAAGAALRGTGAAVQPFSAGGRERIVTEALLQSATDPATLAQRIDAGVNAPGARLPDSPVTTALAARDPRLLAMEASVRDGAAGIEAAAPLRDAQFQRAVSQNTAVDAMADGRTPGERGAAIRGDRARGGQPGSGLRGAEQRRRQEVNRAYEAIDPDGSSRLPLAPVQAALADEAATRWGPGAGQMPPALRALFDDLEAAGEAQPWRFMQNVRSRAAALAGDSGMDTRAQTTARRVVEAIDQTAEQAALPIQPAARPVSDADLDRLAAQEGRAARGDVAAVLGDMRSSTADRRAQGLSLVQFLRRQGGFRENPNEIADGRRMPGLFNRNGLTIDRAMQEAIDAGYYPGRSLQHDALSPGMTLTRSEFLRDLGEEVNGRARIFPETTRVAREDAAGRARLRNDVERDLDGVGVGLNDSPERIFAAARPVEEAAPAAPMDRPDGTFAIPPDQRFTPDQAARWREAAGLRRRLGEDFNRDTTGANATGQIVATADYGAPRMVDERVPAAALANVSALRQTLRASGGAQQVRQALQGQFIDNLSRAMRTTADVTDGAGAATRVTSPAGFRRFWEQNEAVARELFSGPELRRLELLSRDFSEASIGANTGRARNSQTVQNLSVAALIARASNGLLDPTNPTVATFLRPVAWAYRMPEQATRELFGQAMADPRFAAMLLARASPNSVRRAASYVEQNMSGRIQEIALVGGARQALRTGAEEERRQAP